MAHEKGVDIASSVLNCGALAPEWLFWTSLWRQKISGAGRKKQNIVLFRGKYYSLKYFSVLSCFRKKLLHKNAIKMARWGIFNFIPSRKYLKLWRLWAKLWRFSKKKCGAFWKNCGAFHFRIIEHTDFTLQPFGMRCVPTKKYHWFD